ncbi:MAG TPA: XRE family transcriptional regulator [Gemmatimonadaceae bacterium]|nr:XRE family transcriptional regulator [Gemmatimonadaceae bacterium]
MTSPRDPIPELKLQAGAELARFVEGWNADDIAYWLRTDRSRIADIRRGNLVRFSLETLIRFLERAGLRVELRLTRIPKGLRHHSQLRARHQG